MGLGFCLTVPGCVLNRWRQRPKALSKPSALVPRSQRQPMERLDSTPGNNQFVTGPRLVGSRLLLFSLVLTFVATDTSAQEDAAQTTDPMQEPMVTERRWDLLSAQELPG